MSFEETLRARLAVELGLPEPAVYFGLQAQRVPRRGVEVWIEPQGSDPAAAGGRVLRYALHLRLHGQRASDRTGAADLAQLRALAARLQAAWDGRRPFDLPGLVGLGLQEGDALDLDGDLELELSLQAVLHD